MASDSHTKPGRWIKDDEVRGLVRERATGVFYVRTNFSRGPGFPPAQKVRSLQTKSRAEALRRFRVVYAELQKEVEQERRDADGLRKGRTRTPTIEDEARFWKEALTAAPDDDALRTVEFALSDRLYEIAGDPIGEEVVLNEKEVEVTHYTYDAVKEAKALKLAGLVSGDRVPMAFHLEAFLAGRTRTARYDYRIRRAVTEFGKWLEDQPEGNSIKAVSRRTAALFTDHLRQTLKPHTLKGWKSSLSLYWDWLHTREEVEANPWKEVKLDARLGKTDVRAFTDEEIVALFEGTADETMLDFMRVAALSGMRENEIGRLTVKDAEGGWFNVRKSKTDAGVRMVPIHPDLAAIVERRTKDKTPDAWLFDDLRQSNGKGRGRADKFGEDFTAYRRSVGVDEVPEGAKRSNVVFHSFRHWFTTAVINSGAMPTVASTLVGHAEGMKGMTLGTYYKGPTGKLLREALEAVRLPTRADLPNSEGDREEAA
jgi:integrase